MPATASPAWDRSGAFLLGRFVITGSVTTWAKYVDLAYPGRKPADWQTWLSALQANLREPGRVKAARQMGSSKASKASIRDAAAQRANVRAPVLVVMGGDDSDFPDPEAEAAAIVDLLPPGLGRYRMIENAGHYPHAQYPREVAAAIIAFLTEAHPRSRSRPCPSP